jgi:magnesium/cobalt transport protein CorA
VRGFRKVGRSISAWDGGELPDEAIGWAVYRPEEKEAALALLQRLGLGPRFQDLLLSEWRRAKGTVGARGVGLVLELLDGPPSEQPAAGHLGLVVTRSVLISVAPEGFRALEDLLERPEAALADGLDYLVFQLVSPVLDRYEERSEELVDGAEHIEEGVLATAPGLYADIFQLRQRALRLRRVVEPALDAVALLEDHRFADANPADSPYYHDLVRRLGRIANEIESVRDGMGEVVESYASVVANQMNKVMKFLTVLSTVFLPATLIASIYGMNFRIPEYHWKHGYAWSLAMMLVVSGGLILYMARKGWFD